ncbi:MAG: hypothetical protein AAGU32_12795, partial [Bacillota bacterium]
LPFQDVPFGMEAAYLAIYNVSSNLFRFLGAFAGKLFISAAGERVIHIFGVSMVSSQYICFICTILYIMIALLTTMLKSKKPNPRVTTIIE